MQTDAPGARRGRPPKPEAEKLQPVTINLRPADFDAACSLAKVQGEPVAVVLREMALGTLRDSTRRA